MKKLFFSALLFLSLSIMFISCEKAGINDEGNLEGKWWIPVKGELIFNGKVVRDKPKTDYVLDYKAYFEGGNYTCVDINSGESYVFGYSYLNGILRLAVQFGEAIELNINKLTRKEGVVDRYVQSKSFDAPDGSSIIRSSVIDTYLGTDIYGYTLAGVFLYGEGVECWYYNDKGEKVPCKFGNHSTSKVFNEKTGEYETKDSFEFWYDTERFYFKAE